MVSYIQAINQLTNKVPNPNLKSSDGYSEWQGSMPLEPDVPECESQLSCLL